MIYRIVFLRKKSWFYSIVARTATNITRGFGLTTGFIGSRINYTLTTESLTITTDSHNWVTTPAKFLQGPGPPADPTGSHWPSTNSSELDGTLT
jgi:hypothetical protein